MTKRRVRRVKVVINPAAGKAEPVLSVLNDVFGPAAIEWDVVVTHEAGDGERAAREAAAAGYDFVAAYGGDGSVAEVAAGLAETDTPMLLLPGGTGNALAADLGIPPVLADAAALITTAGHKIKKVDLGRSGDRWFVLRLTMGFEATMVDATTPDMKGRYGWLAYAVSGLQTLSAAPVAEYTITVDGETIETAGVALLVANSAETGVAGVRIANDVHVSDGLLDIIVLERAGLGTLVGSAADAAVGLPSRALCRWRGKAIHIEATPQQVVLSDGEDAGKTPVDVTVAPGALRVVVPKPARAAAETADGPR